MSTVHLPSRYRHCLPGECSSSLVGGPSIAGAPVRSCRSAGWLCRPRPRLPTAKPKASRQPRPLLMLPNCRSACWPPGQRAAASAGYSFAAAKAAARGRPDGQGRRALIEPRRTLTRAAIRPPRSASSGSRSSSCFQKVKTHTDYCCHMAGLRHHGPWNEKRLRNRFGCTERGQFDNTPQASAMNLSRLGSGSDVAPAQRQRKRQPAAFRTVTD